MPMKYTVCHDTVHPIDMQYPLSTVNVAISFEIMQEERKETAGLVFNNKEQQARIQNVLEFTQSE